ncbi:MAG: nuclease-related domain-containing protein [Candidatus Limnocylindrales bacterium]
MRPEAETGTLLTAGDDVSAAGASARAEFERRNQRHVERVAQYRPRLLAVSTAGIAVALAAMLLGQAIVGFFVVVMVLGAVSRVVATEDSTLSWATGSQGETLTAQALEQLKIDGFVILHDRRIPGSSANIDHIVIGPPGIAIVETKSYSGRLRVRGNDVYVGGYHRTSQTVDEARREAVAVSVALAGELERRQLGVRAILCIHRADLPFFGASPGGVSIVDGRGLVKLLRRASPRLSAQDVRDLATLANDRLRPAVAPLPELYGRLPLGASSVRPVEIEPVPEASPIEGERFMPPTRRAHLQAAREARARATDQRTYWTRDGLTQGKAPPAIPPEQLH